MIARAVTFDGVSKERMDQMRQEMFQALEADLGPRKWAVTPNDTGRTRAGCNDDDEAETVILPAYGFQGSYPESEWKQSAARGSAASATPLRLSRLV